MRSAAVGTMLRSYTPARTPRGHIGYVQEGRISIDFNGEVIDSKAGDGIFIPEGEESRHKGMVARGEKVLVILFEEV